MSLVAVDLFAGGGGWDIAAHAHGIRSLGVEIMPEAIATREANCLETIYQDVWRGLFDDVVVPPYAMLIGSPPCFGAGTPVLTEHGIVAIEDVVVGDRVWTHESRWQRVSATMSREARVIRIGAIVTTHDHPFYTRQQRRTWNNGRRAYDWALDDPQWVPASESRGGFWATPLAIDGIDIPGDLPDPWIAGRYVADGWVGRDGLSLAIGDGTVEPAGDWAISQSGPHCRRFTKRTPHDAMLVESFGAGAHGKTIPTWLLAAPVEYRESFLRGYLDGDGTSMPGGHRAVTVSARLAMGLRMLAISLGYTSGISLVETPPTTVIEGRVVSQSDYYTVTVNRNDGRYTRDIGGHRWVKQRRRLVELDTRTVYDLTVETDHSFIAWGNVVHNCQSFSTAGKGAGRKALDEVIALIEAGAYRDPEALRAFGEAHDERTALVLTPLAHVWRDAPIYVVLEQVPPVLPVWEAYARVMREWGYSVWTGNLQAEQYGVPQTRRRAVLIARADDKEAKPPAPTHSRYHSRNPERLDEGVEKWVSMAEALGWGMHRRPSPTITGGGTETGGAEPIGHLARYTERDDWTPRALRSNYSSGGAAHEPPPGNKLPRTERSVDEPAITVTSKIGSAKWLGERVEYVNGTHEHAARRRGDRPAPTVHFGQRANGVTIEGDAEALDEIVAARVNDQSDTAYDSTWPAKRPSTTIAGRGLVPNPGATANRFNGSTKSRNDGIRVTVEEAATLQSFPPDFEWCGSMSKRYLQVGNAVPPLLAWHVLRAAIE